MSSYHPDHKIVIAPCHHRARVGKRISSGGRRIVADVLFSCAIERIADVSARRFFDRIYFDLSAVESEMRDHASGKSIMFIGLISHGRRGFEPPLAAVIPLIGPGPDD